MIENSDVEFVKQRLWNINHTGYPVTNDDAHKSSLYLHIELTKFRRIEIPQGYEVDHKDRNKLNALKDNLRVATPHQNSRNKGLLKNNTSGTSGVGKITNTDSISWYAAWVIDGKTFTKRFNSKEYGEENAKAMAVAYRKEMEIKHNLIF